MLYRILVYKIQGKLISHNFRSNEYRKSIKNYKSINKGLRNEGKLLK